MPDDDWLGFAVLYSDDGKNFTECEGGWYCAVTMDASIGKIDIRLIPPNRKRIDPQTRNEVAVKILRQLGFEEAKEPPSHDELEAKIREVIKKRGQSTGKK
jgi:hypothetical protein